TGSAPAASGSAQSPAGAGAAGRRAVTGPGLGPVGGVNTVALNTGPPTAGCEAPPDHADGVRLTPPPPEAAGPSSRAAMTALSSGAGAAVGAGARAGAGAGAVEAPAGANPEVGAAPVGLSVVALRPTKALPKSTSRNVSPRGMLTVRGFA